MVLKTKVNGAWRDISSLKVKINGEGRDISTLSSKKDGAWVTVYSSGALIEFTNYPYPIPVASGWKYSTDKTSWTTVSADGEINTSGTFTGFIKANSITLNEYCTESSPPGQAVEGTPLSAGRSYPMSFVNNSKGYVCGGTFISYNPSEYISRDTVDVYDSSGNRTTGTSLSVGRSRLTSFVNNSKGYACGGYLYTNSSSVPYSTVDVYDSSGNRTTGASLSVARRELTSFVNNSKGYVCGGNASTDNIVNSKKTVDVYDSSGNRTTGTNLYTYRYCATSFTNNSKGYVCGGTSSTYVDVYDSSGNRSSGASLSVEMKNAGSFVNGSKGYVFCEKDNTVNVYDSSGNRTIGTSLVFTNTTLKGSSMSFVNNSKGFVIHVHGKEVNIYDVYGNMTIGKSISKERGLMYRTAFVNGSKGYLCGGYDGNISPYYLDYVEIYLDTPGELYTKLPITGGSTYTLNGVSGTADVSKVMEFDSKVSGTIDYRSGTIPNIPYSIIYDKSLASDPEACLTYAGSCAGFTPMAGGNGNTYDGSWAEGNGTLFDAIKVGYIDNSGTFVEQSKSAVAGSTTYNCFTRIPKIYQKVTDISDAGDNSKVQLDLSLQPFEGATLHPAFVMDGKELKYKDIGRYLSYNNSGVLESKSGKLPTASSSRSNFRTYAKANGGAYGLTSYMDWDLVNKLILMGFKSFYNYKTIGCGYKGSGNSKANTGSTDGHAWSYGTSSKTVHVSVFGLEDWWGNLYQHLDNYNVDSHSIYYSQSSSPGDSVSGMTKICSNRTDCQGDNVLTCRAGLNDFFIVDTTGGSSNSGMCAVQTYNRYTLHIAGSSSGIDGDFRAWTIVSGVSTSYMDSTVGARLVHWE